MRPGARRPLPSPADPTRRRIRQSQQDAGHRVAPIHERSKVGGGASKPAVSVPGPASQTRSTSFLEAADGLLRGRGNIVASPAELAPGGCWGFLTALPVVPLTIIVSVPITLLRCLRQPKPRCRFRTAELDGHGAVLKAPPLRDTCSLTSMRSNPHGGSAELQPRTNPYTHRAAWKWRRNRGRSMDRLPGRKPGAHGSDRRWAAPRLGARRKLCGPSSLAGFPGTW